MNNETISSPGSVVCGSDPVQAAKDAGLRYVTDRRPGITRQQRGESYSYLSPKGEVINDEAELQRIKSLAIPPAYRDVWICPSKNGHLQATGRDARGRKQYRYHPRWREVRDQEKYGRMIAFGKALPSIRERLREDLAKRGMPREKVLATVVRLLERSLIRVGNDEYARSNDSYGLTTMRNEHVDVSGSTVVFNFRGKSGKTHQIDLKDRALARIVRKCQELPGDELFEYIDEAGEARRVDSGDVNAYLREITGQEFTAKDFRTWAGTSLAALALKSCATYESQTEAKRNIVEAIKSVSERLGNTPSICRKCYVHPAVIDSYLQGLTVELLEDAVEAAADGCALSPQESAVLAFLEGQMADSAAK